MHSALLAGPIVNLTIFFSFAAAIFFLLGVGPQSFSGGPPVFGRKAAVPPLRADSRGDASPLVSINTHNFCKPIWIELETYWD